MSAVLVECMRLGRASDHIFSGFRGCRTSAGRVPALYSTTAKVLVGTIGRAAAIRIHNIRSPTGRMGKPSPLHVDGGLLAMRVTDPF